MNTCRQPYILPVRWSGCVLLMCLAMAGCTTSGTTPVDNSGQTPPARLVYVVDNAGQLASVDLDTGEVSLIGDQGTPASDMAFDAHNNLWTIDAETFYRINPDTSRVAVGKHTIPGANALAVGPDGTLYAAGSRSTWLYAIDTSTGVGRPVADVGQECDGGMTFLNGKILLSSGESLVSVDPANDWSAGVVGPIGFVSVWGLSVDSKGTLYGFSNQEIITIDPSTGAGTRLWDLSDQALGTLCGGSFSSGA